MLALAAVFCLLTGSGAAGVGFSWPAGLTEIGEEAFEGNTALTALQLPESITTVGSRAFAGCSGLNAADIPDSVTRIGDGAFDDCGEALLIRCVPGSEAHRYALENRVDYRADTVCRALVIGQTYAGTELALQGPANDMQAVRFCLNGMGWTVTARSNLSVSGMLSAIGSAFASAGENDISLFYYSGHGIEDGFLVGNDGAELLSPAELKTALDSIPGRKIVVTDACYSGQLIAEEGEGDTLLSARSGETARAETSAEPLPGLNPAESPEDQAAHFVIAFQAAFRGLAPRGVLNTGSFFVITAARADEKSEEDYFSGGSSGRYMGIFTCFLLRGIGYDGADMQRTDLHADQNGDQAVSVEEAYQWAYRHALEMNPKQHAAVWPAGCRWFAPFRP